ncbi:hypothetical protein V7024_22000 [Bacillus sp. JJ864]|uniref:hypothetical protein n=1 Tax=Bacillus sp. JJ864 TaxID=3122975 RepID=UPI00300062BF
MPNYFVFNTPNNYLYSLLTNTYTAPAISSTPEGDATKSQIVYTLPFNTSVASSQNLLIQVSNPSGSGKTMYVSRISGGTTAAATVNIYSGGTISGGSTPTPVNTYIGSSNTSVMTTKTNTGTLGGSPQTILSLLVTAGLFSIDINGGIIVPPNTTLTATVGTGSLTASANIMWWEY